MDRRRLQNSYEDLCAEARTIVDVISPTDLAAIPSTDIVILDVREADECLDGILPGAIQVPRGQLEHEIEKRVDDPTQPLCLYCSSGNRSILAARTLKDMGYGQVCSLDGGFTAWLDAELEISAGPGTRNGRPESKSIDHGDWSSIRSNFAISGRRVQALDGEERPLVYLDHAATTHPPDFAMEEVRNFLSLDYANVHRASYQLARRSTLRFEDAYRTCAGFVGADLDHHCVVFTSNTTAACEIVAHAVAPRPGAVLVTDLEHHSSDLPHRRRGRVVRVGLDPDQRLDMAALREVLRRDRIKLVSVTGAANVTGWMPPIHEIASLAHEAGALICVDAAQLVAHAPIDMGRPGEPTSIDFLVAAGHKAYAPFGAGFLVGPRDVLDSVDPVVPGGGVAAKVDEDDVTWLPSPDRHQYGTPNVGGAIGMSVVLELLRRITMPEVRRHEMALFHRMVDGLRDIGGITLYGPQDLEERVGIVPFNVEGVSDMLTAAVLGEEFAIAVRNGRFCSHVHSDRLLRRDGTEGAVRASIGLFNDESDIDAFLAAVEVVRRGDWKGTYSERGGQLSGQNAGRCADRWMENAENP
ncbi:MAG: aminotransferase class V-fold PLP-dependent enzyme [Phycisphaera sp.]|nr:aminotransferase class V-fold PLP-dependent enzyme [Phycisphaera sp.]